MNIMRKTLFISVASVVLLMMLYPPFHFHAGDGIVLNLGYGFILDPPIYRNSEAQGTVDSILLITQWISVVLISMALWLVFDDHPRKK